MAINVAYSPYRSSFRQARRKRGMFRAPETNGGFDLGAAAGRAFGVRVGVARTGGGRAGLGKLNLASVKEAVFRLEFGPASLIIALMMVSTLLIVLYLATYNSIATKGYDLKRLEADHQQLMSQYDIRNMKLAEVKSLTNMIVNERIADSMRKPGSVQFVNHGDTVIASK